MARENRDRQGGPSVAVPAQRSGHHPTTPPIAPEAGASPPPVPSPPTPPPAVPPGAAQSAVPSGDPGATGRSGGSRTNAPAATPAAPRGRDTTDRPGEGRASGDGRGPGPGDRDGSLVDGGPRSGTGHESGADGGGPAGQLLDDVDRDLLGRRLHRALAGFVDSPHDSVAEAAEVLAAAEETLVAALRDRRAALRAGWQDDGGPDGPGPDTEQLRLTLRTYREVTERLLRV